MAMQTVKNLCRSKKRLFFREQVERQPEEIGRFVGSWKCVNKSGISFTVGNFQFFRQRERERESLCVGQSSSRPYLTHPCGRSTRVGLELSVCACEFVRVERERRIYVQEKGDEERHSSCLQSPSAPFTKHLSDSDLPYHPLVDFLLPLQMLLTTHLADFDIANRDKSLIIKNY